MIWVSPCFGFPFSFYISVLGIPGYFPGITSDLMIVVISVWVYICMLLDRRDHRCPCAHKGDIIYCKIRDHLGMVNFVVRRKSTKIKSNE